MAGLLTQGQTPVVEPTAPTQTAPGKPDASANSGQVDELLNSAVNNIYSKERLPKLKQLFQEGGVTGFPRSMGVAITEGLADVPDDIPDDILSEVGVKLFEMVAEDIISSGVLNNTYDSEGVTPAILVEAAKESLKMWSERNPGRFNEAEFVEAWKKELSTEGGVEDIRAGQLAPDTRPGELPPGQQPANMQMTPGQEGREMERMGMLRGGAM